MKPRTRNKILTAALAMTITGTATANIQQQVNAMFNSMVNVTAPGAYETATAGVITGGNIALRNRISTVSLVHFTPPSAKGGCGGINMYMGSFSFINAEEFIGLMRNIASNAAGVASAFAFNMALEAIDSQTSGVITKLRDGMQAMNEAMLNSCQIASGIVTESAKALQENRDLSSAVKGVASNVASDFFGSKRVSGESPAQRIYENGAADLCADMGNILWCAMQKSQFNSQYLYGSQENAEFMMSLTGSYLVSYATDSEGGKNFTTSPIVPLDDATLEIFVEGTTEPITVYSCDEDCLNPSTQTISGIDGLAKKIIESVRASNLFERIQAGDELTTAEKQSNAWLFSSRIGSLTYSIIHLAGPEAAYAYLSKHINIIALEASLNLIKGQLTVVSRGVAEMQMADAQKLKDDIDDRIRILFDEARVLTQTKYSASDPIGDFAKIQQISTQRDSGRVNNGANINGSN